VAGTLLSDGLIFSPQPSPAGGGNSDFGRKIGPTLLQLRIDGPPPSPLYPILSPKQRRLCRRLVTSSDLPQAQAALLSSPAR